MKKKLTYAPSERRRPYTCWAVRQNGILCAWGWLQSLKIAREMIQFYKTQRGYTKKKLDIVRLQITWVLKWRIGEASYYCLRLQGWNPRTHPDLCRFKMLKEARRTKNKWSKWVQKRVAIMRLTRITRVK